MSIALRIGDTIADAYVVERVVGVGGMAVVAVASHVSQRHRVAIKMLLSEPARSKEVVKRFEREQRTLMQLHSEHTLRIYGAGEHHGRPYMLVEFLQGSDLAELLKNQGPLPVERAVEYVLQACHAIAEAHALGITHRDIKPGNLFLTRRTDGSPCLKVLDFGISKVSAAPNTGEEPTLTRTKAVMGSPFYMSPEQMISAKNVDHRTDIWALGVTLHELLTKTLPFAANTARQVCARILGDSPTPLRAIRPSYPLPLEQVILRCLQRRPEDRYANIADLARELAALGPEHARFAVAAISELVEPTAPSAEPGTPDALLAADAADASATTIYLPSGDERAGHRPWLTLAASLLSFGLGMGLGWVLSLPTDPTREVTAAPSAPAIGAVQAASSASSSTAETGVSHDEQNRQPRATIDLDAFDEPGGSRPKDGSPTTVQRRNRASASKTATSSPTASASKTATGSPTASAPPAPHPSAASTAPAPPAPSSLEF